MTILHDPAIRTVIKARLNAVRSDAVPRWGAMTVDQMMWHVGSGIEHSLGRLDPGAQKALLPLPKPLLRFIVLNLPWPKGVPTPHILKATARHDFTAERRRCLQLIDEFTARPLKAEWPVHPTLGVMSGTDYSRLQAKHFDHHLKQFGA